MEATKKGKLAENIVKDYLIKEGWDVTPRKNYEGEKRGFDFYAINKKSGEKRFVEVKGVKYDFKVPDMSETEWENISKGEMVASHLYVVGNIESEKPHLYILAVPKIMYVLNHYSALGILLKDKIIEPEQVFKLYSGRQIIQIIDQLKPYTDYLRMPEDPFFQGTKYLYDEAHKRYPTGSSKYPRSAEEFMDRFKK
ncbi:DUF3883 domain-containing protein [Candidatus Bathyarchaeota archaeon]|nr:DUF3883 domain-containing protein [Candidatus Bathyarchaeota archaeon]